MNQSFTNETQIDEFDWFVKVNESWYTPFFYKQSIFDPRRKNCLSFSKKSPQKIL